MKLLTNPSRCPSCGVHAVSFDVHRCLSCQFYLFRAGQDYGRFQQETCWRDYWVYFSPERLGLFRGWVHSDNLEDAVPREAKEHEAISL